MRAMRLFGAFGVLVAAAGCGGTASVKQAAAPPCETRVPAVHPADTLTVVVFDKIDPAHAPWPRNREERFVFSHLYETLVKVDCRGVVQPGLAKSWKKASDGWYIELQEDAHFWDDTMVTAADVEASFEPAIKAGLVIGPVDVVDETHAIIHGNFDVKLLALPMLSVRKESTSGISLGTGAWMIDSASTTEGIVMHPAAGRDPVVRVMQEDPADATDILSGSADAMITDNAAVIDYAHTKGKAAVVPLMWDKAYVLIDPMRVAIMTEVPPELPESVRNSLARDAVPVDARGGTSILDKSTMDDPLGSYEPIHGASASSQLVYIASDPTARALAERIVALAGMDTTSSSDARAVRRAMPGIANGTRAIGLPSDQFANRLQSRPASASFVVSLSWHADFPLLASYFHEHAPWLTGVTAASGALIPLVETRPHFIAMSDRISYVDDKNGTVRIMPPGAERVR